MSLVLKKFGFRDQNPILIVNQPEEFQNLQNDIQAAVHTEIKQRYDFIMFFATSIEQAKSQVGDVIKSFNDDGHLWFCYPKRSSKKYQSDLNRTINWNIFVPHNYEAVALISIDDDWTALRFKNLAKIRFGKKKQNFQNHTQKKAEHPKKTQHHKRNRPRNRKKNYRQHDRNRPPSSQTDNG